MTPPPKSSTHKTQGKPKPAPGRTKAERLSLAAITLSILTLAIVVGSSLWQSKLNQNISVGANKQTETLLPQATRIETLENKLVELKKRMDALLQLERTNTDSLRQISQLRSELARTSTRLNLVEFTTATEGRRASNSRSAVAAKGTVIEKTSSSSTGAIKSWFINLGTFNNKAKAKRLLNRLKPTTTDVELITMLSANRPLYRVRVNNLTSRKSAELQAQKFQSTLQLGSNVWVGHQ